MLSLYIYMTTIYIIFSLSLSVTWAFNSRARLWMWVRHFGQRTKNAETAGELVGWPIPAIGWPNSGGPNDPSLCPPFFVLYIPRDPSTFSAGDWRHRYVGLEGPSKTQGVHTWTLLSGCPV